MGPHIIPRLQDSELEVLQHQKHCQQSLCPSRGCSCLPLPLFPRARGWQKLAVAGWALLHGAAQLWWYLTRWCSWARQRCRQPPTIPPGTCICTWHLLPDTDSQADHCFAQPPWQNNNATSKTSFWAFFFSFSSVLQWERVDSSDSYCLSTLLVVI